jgi:hypothetical protein
MVCFLDNDVILKLTACDLFWEAIATLNVTPADLRVLDTARPVFQNSANVKSRYPEEIRNAAIAIVRQCQKVSIVKNETFKALQQIDDIDQGEATLISALPPESPFWLITGDKRCLCAIAHHPQLNSVRQKLKGRVICLEQLILKLLNTHSFDFVLAKILPARDYDTALKSCFGSGTEATPENVTQALKAYIADLRQNSGELLADW